MPHSDEIFKRGLSSNTQDAVRSYCWERILVFERSFRSALYSSKLKNVSENTAVVCTMLRFRILTSKRTVGIGRRMLNFGRRTVKCTPY